MWSEWIASIEFSPRAVLCNQLLLRKCPQILKHCCFLYFILLQSWSGGGVGGWRWGGGGGGWWLGDCVTWFELGKYAYCLMPRCCYMQPVTKSIQNPKDILY